MVILLGRYVIRLSRAVYLNILPLHGKSCHSLPVSHIYLTCDINSDSLQCLGVYENVSHLLDSGECVVLPGPSLLYDGLGYFVVLTGRSFSMTVQFSTNHPLYSYQHDEHHLISGRQRFHSINWVLFSVSYVDAVDLTCVTFSASLGFAITSISSQRLLIHARGVYLTTLTSVLMTQRSWQRRERNRLRSLRRRFQRRTHLRPSFALGDKRRTKPRPTEN